MHLTAFHMITGLSLAALLTLGMRWLYRKTKKRVTTGPAKHDAAGEGEEIDLFIHEAGTRLNAARPGTAAHIGNLPLYLLIGDSGSAKTSVMLHSGVEPELLSGQVYENSDVIATPFANVWFARRALFVEAGGGLLHASDKWSRLMRKLAPRMPVVGKSEQPPRAVVVFYDCENFTRPNAQEAVKNAARNLRLRLGEISQAMGIDLPVYVLFTKMDRLPFFTEYAGNFSNDEAQQVFGTTLPVITNRSETIYAEVETVRLTDHFDGLFRSLADARTEFLARERDSTKLPAAYEFPRQFRKIRPAAVQFLVDLCRPSQLTVGPFLRGFYFTGVRPVVILEEAPVRHAPVRQESAVFAGATQMLRRPVPARAQAVTASLPQIAGSRKVPQWVFLNHFIHEVVLPDRAAQGTGGVSLKTSAIRRILLSSAAVVCLLLAALFTVSFFRNRSLAANVLEAAVPLASEEQESLGQLEMLRQSLAKLTAFRRSGPPGSFRWGLYAGDDLYLPARRLYFVRFQQLLLGPTQSAMLENLGALPAIPGPDYGPTYDALKAYLITTAYHDKSTRAFLTPVLLKWWSGKQRIDGARQELARKQFDFYASELRAANPFSDANDAAAIEKARHYLAQFAGIKRVYAFMTAEAAKKAAAINFNRQFPGSAAVVLETHEVSPAFTKAGWDFIKDALRHVDRYFSGEKWVLGDQELAELDTVRLEKELRDRYYADFLQEWRLYIKSARVQPYADVKDAASKLRVISGNQSPLLAFFAVASQNTAVDDPAIAAVFQPIHAVVPPGSQDRYIAPPNQNYINALVTLQASLENTTGQPSDPATPQALNSAVQAKVVTRQMAQSFQLDRDGHVEAAVQKLLEDPIANLEQALRGALPAELNAGGKALCSQFRAVTGKFPFNPGSKTDATPADVNAVFRKPDGALWTFYEKSLQKALVLKAGRYEPSGAVSLNPAFVRFFNNGATLAGALYSTGGPDPAFTYNVQPGVSDGVQGIALRVDGQTLDYTAGSPAAAKPLSWQAGAVHDMTVSVRVGGSDFEWQHHTGIWGVFHFFAEARQRTAQGLEWPVGAGGQQFKADGKPVTVRLQVDLGPLASAFQNGLSCVAEVAR